LPKRMSKLMTAVPLVLSLDADLTAQRSSRTDNSRAGTMADVISDPLQPHADDLAHKRMVRQQLYRLLGTTLTPWQGEIVRLRYGLDGGKPKRVAEISRELQVEEVAVRRAERTALKALRKTCEYAPMPSLGAELRLHGIQRLASEGSRRTYSIGLPDMPD